MQEKTEKPGLTEPERQNYHPHSEPSLIPVANALTITPVDGPYLTERFAGSAPNAGFVMRLRT